MNGDGFYHCVSEWNKNEYNYPAKKGNPCPSEFGTRIPWRPTPDTFY